VNEHVGGKSLAKKSPEVAFIKSKQKQLSNHRCLHSINYRKSTNLFKESQKIQGFPAYPDGDPEPLMPDFDRHGKLHHRTVRQPSLGFLDPSKLT
jgi:hypothetical protein